MSTEAEKSFGITSTIRHGESWADQMDSPGWAAKSPPKFSEDMPDIVIDEQEYDRPSRTVSGSSLISVFVGGLDYGVESRDLEAFFTSNDCKVSRVRVVKSNGKSTGKAFLNVADEAALAAVVKLSGSMFSGRSITVKEDSGPKPARRVERAFERPTSSKMGGRWREDERPRKAGDNGWHAVSKGGKIVDAPAPERRKKSVSEKPVKEEEAVEEAPKERKKLELKPRSKPVSELPEVADSARSSAIFGQAKPRDERAFVPTVEAEEPTPVERRKKTEKPQEVVAEPVVVEEVKIVVPKKKKINNRFAVDSSSDSE